MKFYFKHRNSYQRQPLAKSMPLAHLYSDMYTKKQNLTGHDRNASS
ncbi:hypothetical protein DSUL_20360 [Desulfovibrionales bacterium]